MSFFRFIVKESFLAHPNRVFSQAIASWVLSLGDKIWSTDVSDFHTIYGKINEIRVDHFEETTICKRIPLYFCHNQQLKWIQRMSLKNIERMKSARMKFMIYLLNAETSAKNMTHRVRNRAVSFCGYRSAISIFTPCHSVYFLKQILS